MYRCALQERYQAATGVVAGNYKGKEVVDCPGDADGPTDGVAEDVHVHHTDGQLRDAGFDLEKDLVEERELRRVSVRVNGSHQDALGDGLQVWAWGSCECSVADPVYGIRIPILSRL